MRLALAATIAALTFAVAAPAFAQAPLSGPNGTSLNKVLVIGTDGTRWDLLESAMKAGRAPNLARLRKQGFGRPSLLDYGPDTVTLSEVGWSSIASGVWEDKHHVDGTAFNMDPDQAAKNGYLDFLTRIERARSGLSTFYAGDWDNLGLKLNGGPIFGTAMDANFSARVPSETLENWDRGDVEVTNAATRYLRRGNPDAGFVYLGVVDESAHLVGSATPTYAKAITTTDGRIGRMLRAIRSRPSYPFESWTIIVVTDHGERPLTEPSLLAHYGKTKLELTSFLLGSGPGLGRNVRKPKIVDIQPTVLHQLGLRVSPAWKLDGRSLSKARPASSARARLRGHRLTVRVKLSAASRARKVRFRLPAGLRATAATARVNGTAATPGTKGRNVTVRVRKGRVHSVSLAVTTRGGGRGTLSVSVPGGKLELPLR